MAVQLRDVEFPRDQQELERLIYEYVDWLDIDLSYQNFAAEMARLDALFTLPSGVYQFALVDGSIAGGVGFRAIDTQTAEVKRLYVRSQFQGLGVGRVLMEHLLERLKALGYSRVVLDAVPPTRHAQKLYLQMGFVEIEPYFDNPTPDTKFFGYTL